MRKILVFIFIAIINLPGFAMENKAICSEYSDQQSFSENNTLKIQTVKKLLGIHQEEENSIVEKVPPLSILIKKYLANALKPLVCEEEDLQQALEIIDALKQNPSNKDILAYYCKIPSAYDQHIILVSSILKGRINSGNNREQGRIASVENREFCSSSNKTKIAFNRDRKNIIIRDVTTSLNLTQLNINAHITSLCFLDNTTLAVAYNDIEQDDIGIQLWNIEKNECFKILKGHTRAVTTLSALPKGFLASGSHDHTVKLWDVETGNSINLFTSKGPIYSVCFSPDGSKLIFGTNNNDVQLIHFINKQKEFTLAALVFLEYLLHQREQKKAIQLPLKWKYLYLYSELPQVFQEQFSDISWKYST